MITLRYIPLFLCVASLAYAQATDLKPSPQPAAPSTRPAMRQITSPEILPDHRVTIRISAPKASDVTIGGDFGAGGKLVKDENGI